MDQLMTTLDQPHGAYEDGQHLEETAPAHPLYAYQRQQRDDISEPEALDGVILAGLVTP